MDDTLIVSAFRSCRASGAPPVEICELYLPKLQLLPILDIYIWPQGRDQLRWASLAEALIVFHNHDPLAP